MRDGVPKANRSLDLAADMRYRGQAYELLVPWTGGLDEDGLVDAIAGFHAMHLERFAHQDAADTPEIVTLRLTARGLLPKAEAASGTTAPAAGPKGRRQIDGHETPVYAREAIGEAALAGPMVIEEVYTALLLSAGWNIRAVGAGHLLAEKV